MTIFYHQVQVQVQFIDTYSKKKYINTIIRGTKKEGNQSQCTYYNKYYIGKVCSSQSSNVFGLYKDLQTYGGIIKVYKLKNN